MNKQGFVVVTPCPLPSRPGRAYIRTMSTSNSLNLRNGSEGHAPQRAPLSNELNEAQREAVEATEGPVLILAGAGTGKTRVLTTRLAHILNLRLAFPSQILAVTFTNKAAREMRERIEGMVGAAVEGLWLGTFHSIAARMLRRHAEIVGLKDNFTIIDTDDHLRLLKQLLQAENVDEKRWPAKTLAAIIDRWKDRGLTPEKVPEGEIGTFANGRSLAFYRLYRDRLRTLNACDFGDLLLHNLEILASEPDILAEWQRRFRYILVDEYQDTNIAQYLWLRHLAREQRNICCVGDDDQSIYGWRGAEVGNILRFEQDFEGARIIRLEKNYRSTPHILAAASGLIAHNRGRLGKTLWTDRGGGEKVRLCGVWDQEEEARLVGETIEAKQRNQESLSSMAILVRAGFQTRAFEERFITLGLSYRVVGGLRFYERLEIRDALAYFRLVTQPDDDLAFERILNVPKRGLGDTTLQVLRRVARADTSSVMQAARRLVTTDEIKPRQRSTLNKLVTDFDRWRSLLATMPHVEIAALVLDESGYTGMWQQDKSIEAPGRLENLKELGRAVGQFDTLSGFLDHVALVTDNDAEANGEAVSLMTLHAAKGLEFDTVFLPGWEEGLFPHQRALDQGGNGALEEERRLAYVGLTRARKHCIISFAANRRIYNQWQATIPSRFIDELPAETVERQIEGGLYGSQPDTRWDDDVTANAGFGGASASSLLEPPAYRWRGGTMRQRWREEADEVPSKAGSSEFRRGGRVFHAKFGTGTIVHVDGDRLEIDFDHAGRKRVISSFVRSA